MKIDYELVKCFSKTWIIKTVQIQIYPTASPETVIKKQHCS